ncbi:3'-5' exonuclease, partial [Coemansia biformis]
RNHRDQSEEPEDTVVSFDVTAANGEDKTTKRTRSRKHKVSEVDDIVDALLGGELEGAERPRKKKRNKKKVDGTKNMTAGGKAAKKAKSRSVSVDEIPDMPDSSSSSEVEDSIVDLYAWESSGEEERENSERAAAAAATAAVPIEPVKPAIAGGERSAATKAEDDQESRKERQRALRLAMAAVEGGETGGSDMPRNEDEWFALLEQDSHGQRKKGGGGDEDDWDSGSDSDDLPTDIVKAQASSKLAGARHTGIAATTMSREKREAVGKYLAIDCEMVGAGYKGSISILARVSIVNFYGHVVLDTFVSPMEPVTDYRTWVSGIRKQDLDGSPSFKQVQQQVADLIKDKILVGHAIRNDLNALMLTHPPLLVRDTAKYGWPAQLGARGTALRKLAASVLQISIQKGEHSSVTDAKTTMLLYRKVKDEWEKSLAPKRYKQQVIRAKTKERFARMRQEMGPR